MAWVWPPDTPRKSKSRPKTITNHPKRPKVGGNYFKIYLYLFANDALIYLLTFYSIREFSSYACTC